MPTDKFEEVRAQIRKLSLRMENESIDAQDVTKQYVEQEARLRNLRAQEQQYLGILRKAATVKDTLEVSDKLNEVRGAIEERQAEFEALSKQVETVAINITLRAEADAQVFGLNWRPLYQLKIAAREGLDGFGEYAASMTTFVFYCPRSCCGCSRSSPGLTDALSTMYSSASASMECFALTMMSMIMSFNSVSVSDHERSSFFRPRFVSLFASNVPAICS